MLDFAGNIADADFQLFDFLHRGHCFYDGKAQYGDDEFGRGNFYAQIILKPAVFKDIPRKFRRFGLPAEIFIEFLKTNKPCDFAFIQTVMTYWYLGYEEAVRALKMYWPGTTIVLGGPYTQICPRHARNLGCDFIWGDKELDVCFRTKDIALPRWDLYSSPKTAAMKITQGCPFKCTYCAVPIFNRGFAAKPHDKVIQELKFLISLGIKNIAFYDDSLLHKADEILKPFLRYVVENKISAAFHTPNALNARFIEEELADLMVKAGFKTFYLGFESSADEFQKQTGAKVFDSEFARAAECLRKAGADRKNICAYLILGHPKFEIQHIEESLGYVSSIGVRTMLADFSPIPGTEDGKLCEKYVDMNEPLLHNKTVFPIIIYGVDKVNRIKDLCRSLNKRI